MMIYMIYSLVLGKGFKKRKRNGREDHDDDDDDDDNDVNEKPVIMLRE